jgi:hypothetical protein
MSECITVGRRESSISRTMSLVLTVNSNIQGTEQLNSLAENSGLVLFILPERITLVLFENA